MEEKKKKMAIGQILLQLKFRLPYPKIIIIIIIEVQTTVTSGHRKINRMSNVNFRSEKKKKKEAVINIMIIQQSEISQR